MKLLFWVLIWSSFLSKFASFGRRKVVQSVFHSYTLNMLFLMKENIPIKKNGGEERLKIADILLRKSLSWHLIVLLHLVFC